MLKTFLIAVALLLPAILLMGVKVFFTKGGKFTMGHVSENEALRKRGIHCVQAQDYEARHKKTLYNR